MLLTLTGISDLFTADFDDLLETSRCISRSVLAAHTDMHSDKSCQFGKTCLFMSSQFVSRCRLFRLQVISSSSVVADEVWASEGLFPVAGR